MVKGIPLILDILINEWKGKCYKNITKTSSSNNSSSSSSSS